MASAMGRSKLGPSFRSVVRLRRHSKYSLKASKRAERPIVNSYVSTRFAPRSVHALLGRRSHPKSQAQPFVGPLHWASGTFTGRFTHSLAVELMEASDIFSITSLRAATNRARCSHCAPRVS